MGTTRTSATGRNAGFTLLEILLALAVIGLMAVVLVGGSARLLATKPQTPDQVFWDAVQRARKKALEGEHPVQMTFDSKARNFDLDDGTTVATVAMPAAAASVEVNFLPGDTGSNTSLLGAFSQVTSLPGATFYPDGTCTPFKLQFKTPVGSREVNIDPWTCAKMLPTLNPDGTSALH